MKVCGELWEISAVSRSMESVAIKGHVLKGHEEELPICSTQLRARNIGINQRCKTRGTSRLNLAIRPVSFSLTGMASTKLWNDILKVGVAHTMLAPHVHTHAHTYKLGLVLCFCNPGTPRADGRQRWEKPWSSLANQPVIWQKRTAKRRPCLKIKKQRWCGGGEDWYPRLSCDLYMCFMVHSYVHTHICTNYN